MCVIIAYTRIPQFCCIKVGYKGVYITRTRYPDAKKWIKGPVSCAITTQLIYAFLFAYARNKFIHGTVTTHGWKLVLR